MYDPIKKHLQQELKAIREAGLFKTERIIASPQDAVIKIDTGAEVINFCANNYLGLSSHPEVVQAAKDTLDSHGFGMSSVRFICGTQDIHNELEQKISKFYKTEDTILYAAAFDANGGLFEPLLSAQDAIISDSLAPAIVGASIKVFDLLANDHSLRDKLATNTAYFKNKIKAAGFDIIDGDSAIVPIMLYDAKIAQTMAEKLLSEGIYVIGFFIQ